MENVKNKAVIELDFNLEDIVFLITDTEQLQRIVVAYQVSVSGTILYKLAQGTNETWHYSCEIATDKNFLM